MQFASAFLKRALRLARTELAALAALTVAVVSLLAFMDLAEDVTEQENHAFDQAVLDWMQPVPGTPRGPWWLREAAADLTSLGGLSVLGLFALIAFAFLFLQRKRLSAVLLAAGLAGGVAFSEGLKALFGRARPPSDYQAVDTLNASFPSGHALLSAVFYLSVGVMLTRAVPGRRSKAFILGVGMALTAIVGLTRVYLGAHWASDVLAGWCVGAAWAMALWLAAYAVQRRQATHHAPLQDAPSPDREAAVIGE